MTFLPKGYEVPKNSGDYMKLKEEGTYKLRILSDAKTGYEYWSTEGKPVRSPAPFEDRPKDIRPEQDGTPGKIKHFWAFAVWNYKEERVQILELTQSTIQTAINDLYIINEWGDPKGYDLVITRKKEEGFVKYQVQPLPHKPVAGNITAAYEAKPVNLNALFDGGNPFEEGGEVEPVNEVDQTAELEEVFPDEAEEVPMPSMPKSIKRTA